MADYTFTTLVSMKPYNCDKYYCDEKYIGTITVTADTLGKALEEYAAIVNDRYYVTVTKHGLKDKQPMYRDYKNGGTRQVGYVITAAMDFLKGRYRVDPEVYVKQFVDLWVEITQSIPFEEMEA